MAELARHRPEWLNPFFRFLNYFDSPYFFFALIPCIWLGFSYRWGLRMFYWLILNNLINGCAKSLVGWPRPSTLFPEVGLFHPTSPGFPSGGAQTCMFVGTLLIYYGRHWAVWPLKVRPAWPLGISYIALISFSRLYLGVHYPIDILGGWALGMSLAILFIKTKEPLEKWLINQGSRVCLFLNFIITSAIMLLFPHPSHSTMMGAAMGVGVGTYFSLKHHLFLPSPKDLNEGIGRSFIGLVCIALILGLLPHSNTFPMTFITGLFMSLGASPICRWFLQKKL